MIEFTAFRLGFEKSLYSDYNFSVFSLLVIVNIKNRYHILQYFNHRTQKIKNIYSLSFPAQMKKDSE